MDLAQLAGLALQDGGGQEAGDDGGHRAGADGGHRPSVHGDGGRVGRNRRLRMLALQRSLGMRKRHQAEKAEAFKAQARHANSTGRNRTNDYAMPTRIGQRQDGQVRMGKGKRRCCELPSQRKMWLSGTWLTKWMGPVMGMPLLVSCLPAS